MEKNKSVKNNKKKTNKKNTSVKVNELDNKKSNKVNSATKNKKVTNNKSNAKKKKKNKKKDNNVFSITEVVIFMFISIVFGIIIGYMVTYSSSSLKSIRNDPELKEIVDTYISLKKSYYKEINSKEFSNSAIKGMIEYLDDPNTVFLDSDVASEFNDSVSGKYIGIGISIYFNGEYDIIGYVNEDGPSDRAGLEVGDIILSINGVDCHFLYGNDISNLISGDVGTKVKIKVKRGEEEKSFVVTMDVIDTVNVTSKVIDEDIGYLKVDMFSSNMSEQFKHNLDELESSNISRLIIDLRDNPGGHLSEARKVLNFFFKKGTVLYRIDDGSGVRKIRASSKEYRDMPIIILVNSSSASASEVFTSCFKDNYPNVVIVGTKTYGKGTVQKTQSLLSGTSIKYTIERWLTSKGVSIDGVGIDVDYEVILDHIYYDEPVDANDNQLQFAIKKIKES